MDFPPGDVFRRRFLGGSSDFVAGDGAAGAAARQSLASNFSFGDARVTFRGEEKVGIHHEKGSSTIFNR